MTKQEKIKESYGNYFELCNPEMNNGWSVKRKGIGFEQLKKKIELEYNQPHNAYAFRPKSLSGIENNNGWIKIENESDLPKENIECFFRVVVHERYCNAGVYINNGRFRVKSSLTNSENFFTVDDVIRNYFPKVTHYKIIEKPQPPIY